MKINRRSFIGSLSILSAGTIFSGSRLLKVLQESAGNFKPMRGNIGYYSERGGTIGWLISEDAVVVADSQFPDTAKNFLNHLRSKTDRKINLLFNTHHHGDHTSGNYFLKEHTETIAAHEDCVRLQKKNYGSGDKADKQVYAEITFSKTWTINIGNEKLSAEHYIPGHTGGDAVLHFQNSNVAHMGDLVFNGVFPYIDWKNGEADIPGWIKNLEYFAKKFDKDTMFIFGHGAEVTGGVDGLNNMKNYFEALLEFVKKGKSAGKSEEEILNAEAVPGFEQMKEVWEGARKLNLEAALKFI